MRLLLEKNKKRRRKAKKKTACFSAAEPQSPAGGGEGGLGLGVLSRRVPAKRGLSRPPRVPGGGGAGGKGARGELRLRQGSDCLPDAAPPASPRRLLCGGWIFPLLSLQSRALRAGAWAHTSWQVVREKAKVLAPRAGVKKPPNFVGLISRGEGGSRSTTEQFRGGRRALTMIQRLKCAEFIFQSAFS